jgi:hypothetical protein
MSTISTPPGPAAAVAERLLERGESLRSLPEAEREQLLGELLARMPDLAAAGRGADNGSTRRALVLEKDPEVVLSLKGWLQFRSWPGGWPLTLLEAAGRLWVGAPDSSFFSVDPFRSAKGPAPVPGRPLWPEARSVRVRARSAGPWLVSPARRCP